MGIQFVAVLPYFIATAMLWLVTHMALAAELSREDARDRLVWLVVLDISFFVITIAIGISPIIAKLVS